MTVQFVLLFTVWRSRSANSYGVLKTCCELGMNNIPKAVSCRQFAEQKYRKHPRCKRVFRDCCEYIQQHLDQDQNLILGRRGQSALTVCHGT